MERIKISGDGSHLHIDEFPDAVKVIRIGGPRSRRLADLALHNADLEFADRCLEQINGLSDDATILRQALWRCAIVHYFKCFGDAGARFKLNAKKIYKDEPPAALVVFNYFCDLRNKHVAHDENSYAQSVPGAILNNGCKGYKIEKIVCVNIFHETLSNDSGRNFRLLVRKAREWVMSEFDTLCGILTKELEEEPYEVLLERDNVEVATATVADVAGNRRKVQKNFWQ